MHLALTLIAASQMVIGDYYNLGKLFAENLSEDAMKRRTLKEELSSVKEDNGGSSMENRPTNKDDKGRCYLSIPPSTVDSPILLVFVSFSMPVETWLSLSKEVEKVSGILVLRGLPGDSFQQLALKMHSLRKQGMRATVQVDPRLFTHFVVEKVPCFVTVDSENFDKLYGNVSLSFALEKMENKNAKKLRKLLPL